MAKPVEQNVRERDITEKDFREALNREVVPVLRRLRQEHNSLVSPTNTPFNVQNPSDRFTFNTTTVTTQQLAEVVGTLIRILRDNAEIIE